jgi:hypothetical protein
MRASPRSLHDVMLDVQHPHSNLLVPLFRALHESDGQELVVVGLWIKYEGCPAAVEHNFQGNIVSRRSPMRRQGSGDVFFLDVIGSGPCGWLHKAMVLTCRPRSSCRCHAWSETMCRRRFQRLRTGKNSTEPCSSVRRSKGEEGIIRTGAEREMDTSVPRSLTAFLLFTRPVTLQFLLSLIERASTTVQLSCPKFSILSGFSELLSSSLSVL